MSKKLVCHIADIPANGMKECEAEGGLKLLIANSGDEYFACQARCPHQDVALCEGLYDGNVLTCHQHLWQWEIRTGAPIGMAEAPLERYEVRVEDGSIYVVPPSALKVAELFDGVSEKTKAEITALGRNETFEEGSVLYNIGDLAEDLYILESGRVEFLVGRDGRTTPAGFMLRKGEVFGWAVLLENYPRHIAKATCLKRSVLWRINGGAVLKTLEADPASGYLVMRKLASLITRFLTS